MALFDSIITLRAGPGLQYSRPIAPHWVDAKWTIAHEIDEVLGIGGWGSVLNDVYDHGSFFGVIGAEDLYRYSGVGMPSLSMSPKVKAFFSINGGVTDLARFNQDHNSDYGDWFAEGPCLPQIQRALFCPQISVDFTAHSPEAVALQAIGYDLRVVAERPACLPLLAAVGVIVWLRRARTRTRSLLPQGQASRG